MNGVRPGGLGGGRAQRPPLWRLALFYAAYVGAAGFAQVLAIIPETGISIWPPSGLFMATLLVSARPSWPWWVVAGLAAELSANLLWFHNPLSVEVLINAGNAIEAMIGAAFVARFCGRPFRLDTLREVLVLAVLGAGVAPAAGALVGSLALLWAEAKPLSLVWPLLWVGDATGVLIVAPLALVLMKNWRRHGRRFSMPRAIEAGGLGLIFAGVGVLALGGFVPFAYLTMPVLLWAAVRFEFEGAAVAVVLLAAMTAALTHTGVSQLVGNIQTQTQKHVLLKLFLAISALSAWMVAALSREHRRALETLRAANADLENRIAERTANLRESERRLAAVLDALPIGVSLVGRNGALLANAVYKAYVPTIIPALDDAGVDLWEGYDHNGRRIERGDYSAARALRGERVWPGQELLFHGDPQRGPVWTRVAALPLRDDQGEIVGATVVVTDIDKEKRARDALRASEENFRAMFDVASVGKAQVDIDTRRFICVNDAFLAISGYSREQLYQLSPFDITHPDDRGEDQAALARMVHGETFSFRREKRYVRPDGSVVWADVASNLIRDANGRPLRTAAVIQDITERKRAEERVRLLMHEVNHRSKNILSVVQAIAVQTVAGDPKEFITRFQDQLRALAASQDLLVNSEWKGASLDDLVRSQLAYFTDLFGRRIAIEGPPLTINAPAADTLGLAFHELATNAGKYGALSNTAGVVTIAWALSDLDGGARRFSISWAERAGPPVVAAKRRGFGTNVIEKLSRLSLDAEVVFDLAPEGLSWRLDCPAARVLADGVPGPSTGAAG